MPRPRATFRRRASVAWAGRLRMRGRCLSPVGLSSHIHGRPPRRARNVVTLCDYRRMAEYTTPQHTTAEPNREEAVRGSAADFVDAAMNLATNPYAIPGAYLAGKVVGAAKDIPVAEINANVELMKIHTQAGHPSVHTPNDKRSSWWWTTDANGLGAHIAGARRCIPRIRPSALRLVSTSGSGLGMGHRGELRRPRERAVLAVARIPPASHRRLARVHLLNLSRALPGDVARHRPVSATRARGSCFALVSLPGGTDIGLD